jgi:hypothetical protein
MMTYADVCYTYSAARLKKTAKIPSKIPSGECLMRTLNVAGRLLHEGEREAQRQRQRQ